MSNICKTVTLRTRKIKERYATEPSTLTTILATGTSQP